MGGILAAAAGSAIPSEGRAIIVDVFGIGAPELIFILILALLIFGPKRLPQLSRTLGRGMAEFRRASTELQRAIHTEIEEPPPRERRTPWAVAPEEAPPPAPPAPPPPAPPPPDAEPPGEPEPSPTTPTTWI
jgi:TatA/E family protein of Tat protein translocase